MRTKTNADTKTRGVIPRVLALAYSLALSLLIPGPALALGIFSQGMLTPETISLAPAGFGSWANQYYFIPDPGRTSGVEANATIWAVPVGGGAPTTFKAAGTLPSSTVGGLFLPTTGWGSNSGKYLTTGWSTPAGLPSEPSILTFGPDGSVTPFVVNPFAATFTTPAIVPSGFGDYGGQLLVSDQRNGALHVIDADGDLVTLATGIGFAPFGVAFAPEGFGSFGGKLFVSQAGGGSSTTEKEIRVYDSGGTSALFATIPLLAGQVSLRQIGFAPAGFFEDYPDEQLLFVSVAGSTFGGGTLGDLLVLDDSGDIVKSLRIIGEYDKFDPRGFLFSADGLIISDASDPILVAEPNDFVPGRFGNVPEPGTLALLGLGFAGLAATRRRKRKQ